MTRYSEEMERIFQEGRDYEKRLAADFMRSKGHPSLAEEWTRIEPHLTLIEPKPPGEELHIHFIDAARQIALVGRLDSNGDLKAKLEANPLDE